MPGWCGLDEACTLSAWQNTALSICGYAGDGIVFALTVAIRAPYRRVARVVTHETPVMGAGK